jgi:hypothetical protein
MILTLSAPSGSSVSVDVSNQFGESVELCCFQFVEPQLMYIYTSYNLYYY